MGERFSAARLNVGEFPHPPAAACAIIGAEVLRVMPISDADAAADSIRRTPLYDVHAELGARFVPFAGWEMPVRYGSILDEARAVRSGVGLFDVSHMGRIEIAGADAGEALNAVLSVDARELAVGRGRYNLVCDEGGGIVDDCIAYRRGRERFLVVPNASNTDAVLAMLQAAGGGVSVRNITAKIAMIACQGPRAQDALQPLADRDLSEIKPFRIRAARVNGARSLIARTGYTGEDGFEIMTPSADAAALWRALMERGAAACGLGARDVLRLEAGLPLHGNDIDTSTNPYEAGLGGFVEPDRDGYAPGAALRRLRDEPPSRRLVGFKMLERGVARQGYPILSEAGRRIGEATSGGPSPTLGANIGMGYLASEFAHPGTRIGVEIRGRAAEAKVVALPFYNRREKR